MRGSVRRQVVGHGYLENTDKVSAGTANLRAASC